MAAHDSNNDLEKIGLNKNFTVTPYVEKVSCRALVYLNSGYALHLKGPSGTGKTSLAMHIASLIGKPTTVIFGNEVVETEDMVGLQYGYRRKILEDNFIHSVHKKVEDFEQKWVDGRIIEACEKGYTLIYDEFTRSKPETNNVFLSILEEKVLKMPIDYMGSDQFIKVHPGFKVIFTSNPEEYAGVYKSQDALLNRFITIELDFPDKESEINITVKCSGIREADAESLVTIVRQFREKYRNDFVISLRDSIKLCTVINANKIPLHPDNEMLGRICNDILTSGVNTDKLSINKAKIENDLADIVCETLNRRSGGKKNA